MTVGSFKLAIVQLMGSMEAKKSSWNLSSMEVFLLTERYFSSLKSTIFLQKKKHAEENSWALI